MTILNVSFITILRFFSNSEDYYGDYYGDYDEDSYDSNDSDDTSNGWVGVVLNLSFCIFSVLVVHLINPFYLS